MYVVQPSVMVVTTLISPELTDIIFQNTEISFYYSEKNKFEKNYPQIFNGKQRISFGLQINVILVHIHEWKVPQNIENSLKLWKRVDRSSSHQFSDAFLSRIKFCRFEGAFWTDVVGVDLGLSTGMGLLCLKHSKCIIDSLYLKHKSRWKIRENEG